MYTAVPQDEINADGKDDVFRPLNRPPWLSRQRNYILALLGALLTASLVANIFFIHRQFFRPWSLAEDLPSKFGTITYQPFQGELKALLIESNSNAAHLRRNVPTEILAHSNFDSLNRTVQDAAWDAPEIEPWNNFVALDEDYTIAMGLPHSQRWPWDYSKGAYILTSAHELHCVVSNHFCAPEKM